MSGRVVLNDGIASGATAMAPSDVAHAMNACILALQGEYMRDDGKGVAYNALQESTLFREQYLPLAALLPGLALAPMPRALLTAFLLNIYNALTIHAFVAMPSLPTSPTEVKDFWKTYCYRIGNVVLSLDDIEHGILRGNRAGHWDKKECNKELLELAMDNPDPRVHFALVCGAQSCPALRVYSESNLERGLAMAAASFCQQEVTLREVSDGKRVVSLSMIFKWYGGDFGKTQEEQLTAIAAYLPAEEAALLRTWLDDSSLEVEYRPYDWSLNKS